MLPPNTVPSPLSHLLQFGGLGHGVCRVLTSGLEIDGGLFASVLLDLVGDFLPFMETVEPGTLNRADMDDDVLAAAVWLNEAITLCAVEPLKLCL